MLRFCPLSLKIMEKYVEVREAVKEDCPQILALIKELAECEEMPDGPKIDHQVLEKDGFNTENPLFKCYVAVCDGQIVGYALYFYIYTLTHKFVHLEDLYVKLNYRGKRIGSRLFDTVAKKTFDEKCQYLQFTVLNTNPAQIFYQNKGSIDLTSMECWKIFRLNEMTLQKLASNYAKNRCEVHEANSDDIDAIKKVAKVTCTQPKIENKTNVNEISIAIEENKSDPPCECLFILSNNEILGYILYSYAYSTWEGKSMYLLDLYITSPELTEVKDNLLFALAKKALDEKCSRIDFLVLDEAATKFYESHGAINLTEAELWHLFRLHAK